MKKKEVYTKKFIDNIKKAEKSIKYSKPMNVIDFIKLTRTW